MSTHTLQAVNKDAALSKYFLALLRESESVVSHGVKLCEERLTLVRCQGNVVLESDGQVRLQADAH